MVISYFFLFFLCITTKYSHLVCAALMMNKVCWFCFVQNSSPKPPLPLFVHTHRHSICYKIF